MGLPRALSMIGLVATGILASGLPAHAEPGSWATASAGGMHTCAIRVSLAHLLCWGENGKGQVGNYPGSGESPDDVQWPRAVGNAQADIVKVKAVSAGYEHTCAVTSDQGIEVENSLYCWGGNGSGQLGDGTTTPRHFVKRVGAARVWANVAGGRIHTCGITTAKNLYCWGENGDGQIGDGNSGADRLTPKKVGGSGVWSAVSAGGFHTCGITTARNLYCWGSNSSGQIGTGVVGGTKVPMTKVGGSGVWSTVNAGGLHTCGVTTAKNLYCWGSNTKGQIGDGTSGNIKPALTKIGGAGVWAGISAGDGITSHHTCGVTAAKNLYCWGSNSDGQIGVGSSGNLQPTLRKVGSSGIWSGVDAGGRHSCAWTANDNLWCWGDNASSQVGNGSTFDRRTPELIPEG